MSKSVELVCDGCGEREAWDYPAMPADWRRLTIRHGNRQWTADVCSPRCAAKAVDATYEEDDAEHLRIVR